MHKELKKYKQYLSSIGLKADTIKNYLWHLEHFLVWLGEEKTTEAKFKEYFDFLLKKYNRVNTINLRLKIINNYLKFLNRRFRFELLSDELPTIKVLNSEQLQEFLELPSKNTQLIGLRDKALLELLYSTGLKVGKIVKLQIKHIDEIKQELIFNNNHIPISPLVWFHLDKYLISREDDSPWLFANLDRAKKTTDNKLSTRSVERIIDKYAKQMDPILSINPQILRNTLAHQLKQEGAQQNHIKDALHFKTKTGAKNYLARF